MFDHYILKLKRLTESFKLFWASLEAEQQGALAVAGLLLGLCALMGGVVLQAAFIGATFNLALFRLMKDSERFKKFLNKHAVKVDVVFSVLTFFVSPLPGVTGAFVALMTGVFFSLFRVVFCGRQPQEAKVEEAEVIVENK